MLNAFRHQRFNTSLGVFDSNQLPKCSTPFGIRDSTLWISRMKCIKITLVLNAFRHQRFNTVMPVDGFSSNLQVLNAFQHQRFNTSAESFNSRLRSACSTPFGIRDSTRLLQQCRCNRSSVLNAFRHQRFDTPCVPDWIDDPLGAQRLSASEIQHIFQRSPCHW